ncbi:urea amidolyase associated protein UAAP1 [Citricoccus nitrophenolicus]|uniref:urea amidolyase associated protein UAAP1 n=1 Tax=Citricoccus nitrophenolicus TaxID=863575 RepID=UPI0031EDB4AD
MTITSQSTASSGTSSTASPSTTATTAGAREHARAQEGTAVESMPRVPATGLSQPPAGVASADVVWAERVAGGNYTHRVLDRGVTVRLTDLAGDACASVLIYNTTEPWERLNVADTMKIQWQVYSGAGQVLLSDQGRAMATVLEDTSGRHDGLYGPSLRARNEERYGDGQVQGPSPAGRELLAVAGAKHGLQRRDLPAALSFFQGVTIHDDGRPEFTGSAGAGHSLAFVTEMPCTVLIANAAHPLDPREDYTCTELDVVAWRSGDAVQDPSAMAVDPERRRAYLNTAEYLRSRGLA